MKPQNFNRRLQILIAIDQLANTLIGGWADETISARSWRLQHEPKWDRSRKMIDWIFLKFFGQKDHCKSAYESEKFQLQMPIEERNYE